MLIGVPLTWRITSSSVKVAGMDARVFAIAAIWFIGVSMVKPSLAGYSVCGVIFAAYFILNAFNIRVSAVGRFLKFLLMGTVVYQNGYHRRRMPVDYVFETPEMFAQHKRKADALLKAREKRMKGKEAK